MLIHTTSIASHLTMLSPTFPLAALHVLLFISPLRAAKQCYFMDGTKAPDTDVPCNPDADVSPCCAMNKTIPDICLTSGLCYAQDAGFEGMIYSIGCTDPTGQDAACPHSCPDQTNNWKGGPSVQTYNVLQCSLNNKFCCREAFDSKNCCGNSSAVMSINVGRIPTKIAAIGTSATASVTVTVTASTTCAATGQLEGASPPSASSALNVCPKDNTAVVGGAVGGVLGAALLASLGLIAVLCMRRPKHQDSHNATPEYFHKVAVRPPQELPASRPMQELPVREAHDDGYRG